ncbi:TraB/GumN family protein [Yoonia sp. 2307UL14-13]|uniref:TraB/GumN family protein n=1 Tax=Yoonia sp. 2307UL14-13 TaxID=3126506 RepID=UPI0030A519CD
MIDGTGHPRGMFSHLRRSLARWCASLVCLSALAPSATAQDWVTPEYCAITDDQIAALTTADLVDPTADEPENGLGRLWQITSSDGAVSHLWGTMHSSDARILRLPQTMRDHLDQSRILALEVDFRFADRDAMVETYSYANWWQDPWLPHKPVLFLAGADPRIEKWIENRVLSQGYQADDYRHMSPGGILSLLLGDPCDDFNAGLIPYQDYYLMSLAHIHGTPIMGLESPDAMMTMINDPANIDYAQAMITTYGAYLEPQETNAARINFMAQYHRGQIGQMMVADDVYVADLLGPNGQAAVALRDDYLLSQRNRDFLAAAMGELEEGGLFVAIGAFNLPGETGLVTMMRDAGFAVVRIPVEGEDE